MIRVLIAFLVCGLSSAFATEVALPENLKDLFHSEVVQVKEPHEKKVAKFRAVALEPVLDKLDPQWRKQEIVILICSDGYKVPIPTREILKNKGRGQLAFERVYGPGEKSSGFTILKPEEGGRIELKPYYLVWTQAQGEKEVPEDYWPYQTAKADATTFEKAYPKALLQQNCVVGKPGERIFMQQCITCHKVNDSGGSRGPILLGQGGVVPGMTDEALKAQITDPTRGGTVNTFMPARSPEDAEKIVEYLRAFQKQ